MKQPLEKLVIGILMVLLAACSKEDVKKVPVADCVYPDDLSSPAPGWVCDQKNKDIAVSAVGTAKKSKAGYGFMKNMAVTDARVQLAQAIKVHVENMVKQYAETTGAADSETVDKVNTSVTRQITDQSLTGSKLYKTSLSPKGDLYVLVGMDNAAIETQTVNALKTSMGNDRALWQQFKAQKGQDEMAAAIASQKEK